MNLSERIDNIELKLRQLGLKMERLQGEKLALLDENKQLKIELDRQKGTADVLKDKLERTQRVLSQKQEEDLEQSEQLKDQIDQYIKEIDRCIEWLHNN